MTLLLNNVCYKSIERSSWEKYVVINNDYKTIADNNERE